MRCKPLAVRLLAAAVGLLLCAGPVRAAKILVIGDSHSVGPFGTTLDAELRRQGHDVSMQAVCGASGVWWLGPQRYPLSICYYVHDYGRKSKPGNGAPKQAPALAKDLLASQPDVVVFALGSNPDGRTAADTGRAAEKLLALMPRQAKCFWVGPPPMPKRLAPIGAVYNELPQAFSRANRRCALIDSRTMLSQRDAAPNDHFYGAPAVAWGKKVAAIVAEASGIVIP